MVGSANLNIMMKAARRAGRSLVKDFREVENLQVSMKGAGDFVSRADLNAEKIIKEDLMAARPTYGWLAEEGGEDEGRMDRPSSVTIIKPDVLVAVDRIATDLVVCCRGALSRRVWTA